MRCCKDWLAACCNNVRFGLQLAAIMFVLGKLARAKRHKKDLSPDPWMQRTPPSLTTWQFCSFLHWHPRPQCVQHWKESWGPHWVVAYSKARKTKLASKRQRLVAGNFGLHNHMESEMRCCTDWLAACGSPKQFLNPAFFVNPMSSEIQKLRCGSDGIRSKPGGVDLKMNAVPPTQDPRGTKPLSFNSLTAFINAPKPIS